MANSFNDKFSGSGDDKRPDRIKIDARCPVCSTLYDFNQIDVIQEEDGATLMYIKCAVCSSASVSLIALSARGLKVANALTDLDRHEVLKYQEAPAISSEEVLSLHQLLDTSLNFLD